MLVHHHHIQHTNILHIKYEKCHRNTNNLIKLLDTLQHYQIDHIWTMRLKTDQKWIRSYYTINAVAILLTNRFTLVFPYLLLIFVAWLCQCWICVDSSSDFLWLLFIRFTFNLSWNGERNWCYFNNNQLVEPSQSIEKRINIGEISIER